MTMRNADGLEPGHKHCPWAARSDKKYCRGRHCMAWKEFIPGGDGPIKPAQGYCALIGEGQMFYEEERI